MITTTTEDDEPEVRKPAAKAEAKLADLAAHSRLTEPEVLDRKRALVERAIAKARAKAQALAQGPVEDKGQP